MPEVPEQETGTTTIGFCHVSQEFSRRIPVDGSLRELWRSARAGRLLHARHGLILPRIELALRSMQVTFGTRLG